MPCRCVRAAMPRSALEQRVDSRAPGLKAVDVRPRISPTLWILWHRRIGDYKQMLALAQALEWPWVAKRIQFRSPELTFLAPWLLDRAASDRLAPPWPEIILCAEALCVRVARQLRQLSGNRTKIVVIGRPPGAVTGYDLILTTAQYRLPPAPNVVELDLPLVLKTSCDRPVAPSTLKIAPPVIALLIGASSTPDWIDDAVAETMCRELSAYAEQRSATVVIVPSPRTALAVEETFVRCLRPPHQALAYREAPDNPYWDMIRLADEIVVTSDSVSMVADALSAGKTVHVYELPQRRTVTFRLCEWLHGQAMRRNSAFSRSAAWLFGSGLIEATADRHRLFSKLAAQGRLSWFGTPPPVAGVREDRPDMAVAVARVRELYR